MSSGPDLRRVFLVHGRSSVARDGMFAFLRSIGLHPIEWIEAVGLTGKGAPYIGEVLDAAFESAQAIVVLMTPDEIAYLRPEYATGDSDPEQHPAAQARPNVLFEAGMALGRNPERTILVELGQVRPFSDVAGRHALRLDGGAEGRRELAQRLETAGCLVDLAGTDWLTAGELAPPPPPGGGLPLGKRLPSTPSVRRVRIDLRYYAGSGSQAGRLEVINRGTEQLLDVNLEFPPEAGNFHVFNDELPLKRLPSGKSASLAVVRAWGEGRDHFDVRVAGRTADGADFSEDVYLNAGG